MPDLALVAPGRVHEIAGGARRSFAFALAGILATPVLWIHDQRQRAGLYPPGIAAFMDPAHLILAQPTGALPILQVMEEALRSGAAPLVVAEMAEAPDLTASRRLQLAAGTGGGRGLCLVPESRLRTNAAETRWICAAIPGHGTARQHWEIVKNKRGRLGQWQVVAMADTGRFMAQQGIATSATPATVPTSTHGAVRGAGSWRAPAAPGS